MSSSSHGRDGPPPEELFDDFFSRREPDREREHQRSRILTEFVRRALEGAVGQMQQTSTVPREALTYLLQQGDRGKREVVRIVGTEISDFLRHVDISSEVLKVLGSLQVDVSASVRFKRTDGGVQPDVSGDSSVKVEGEEIDLYPERGGDEP